ncbi:MAG TPA: flagellar hook-basal body complex protein [Rhodocyclaceae bacterium]|nr:flagellar hook-basal body complex protein [Rhodocyclaceae bacterium]
MLDSVNVALSGLRTFSVGLRNISNNVTNMNSNGYKGTTLQFSDLFYKEDLTVGGQATQSRFSEGAGVGIGSQSTNFADGDIRQTTSSTDLALQGNGFFILRKDGKETFTRDGSFQFDGNGTLIDPTTQAHVAGLGPDNTLVDINIGDLRFSPAQPTSDIKLTGNLLTPVPDPQNPDPDTTFTISNVPVFDASGGQNLVSVILTNTTTTTSGKVRTVEVHDSQGNVLGTGEVDFNGDGSPKVNLNTVSFTITPSGGTPQTVTLDFGTPNTFGGVTSFSSGTASTVAVGSQDGVGVGNLTTTTFDKNGLLTLTYSNNKTVTDKSVALAWFDDPQALERGDGAQFINQSGAAPKIGAAGSNGFGSITGSSLEASNVDLASEFSELVIIQRGYQSASQVLGAANDMAQQLMDLLKGK